MSIKGLDAKTNWLAVQMASRKVILTLVSHELRTDSWGNELDVSCEIVASRQRLKHESGRISTLLGTVAEQRLVKTITDPDRVSYSDLLRVYISSSAITICSYEYCAFNKSNPQS
jgi:hypothetical protein